MQNVKFDNKALLMALEIKRKAENLSVTEAGEAAGVSKATMSRVLRGRRPDVDTLARLVTWCGVDFDHLVNSN